MKHEKIDITKRAVDAAEPGETVRIYRDNKLTGFALVVTPAGVKSYAIEYRAGRGRSAPMRRMVLGRHGNLTPESARKEAQRLLGRVANGEDPAGERKARRDAETFGELIDLYFAKGAPKRDGTPKKLSTIKSDRGRAEQHLKPLLGNKPAVEISRADVVWLRD